MADTPTAGFRNAQWTMTGLPEGTEVGVHPLRTHDGAACNGFLYWRRFHHHYSRCCVFIFFLFGTT